MMRLLEINRERDILPPGTGERLAQAMQKLQNISTSKKGPGIAVYALFRRLDGVVLNLFVLSTRRLKWNNDVT